MTDYLDSDTVESDTTPSLSETHVISDAATIASVTTPSGLDVLYADSATISSVTTPDAVEEFVHPTGSWGPNDDDDGIIT